MRDVDHDESGTTMTKNADLKASIRLFQGKNPGMSYRAARDAVLAAKTAIPQQAALSRDELLFQQYCAIETDADMKAFTDACSPATVSDETSEFPGTPEARTMIHLGPFERSGRWISMDEKADFGFYDESRTPAREDDDTSSIQYGFGKSFLLAARIAELHAPGTGEE